MTPTTATAPAKKKPSGGHITREAADSKTNLLLFYPERIHPVTDPNDPLYDERAFDDSPDEVAAIEALAHNIRQNGVIEELLIRRNGFDKAGPVFQPLVGRRRRRAACLVNEWLRKEGKDPIMVPCRLFNGDEVAAFDIMVAENEHRMDWNPVQRGRMMERHLRLHSSDKSRCAKDFNCTEQTVDNTIALLGLTPELQRAIVHGIEIAGDLGRHLPMPGSDAAAPPPAAPNGRVNGNGAAKLVKLPASAAKELAAVPREKQAAALASMKEAGAVTGRAALTAARQIRDSAKAGDEPVVKREKDETGTVVPLRKMLTRVRVERAVSKLKDGRQNAQAQLAIALLKQVLGYQRALTDYPDLRAAFKDEEG